MDPANFFAKTFLFALKWAIVISLSGARRSSSQKENDMKSIRVAAGEYVLINRDGLQVYLTKEKQGWIGRAQWVEGLCTEHRPTKAQAMQHCKMLLGE